ncbi:MAG TPA: UvrD-helicase domain-containing protein, partial [Steroidobacteraceae bacterium]|nr:UvrD-helicase domain-containing protein [Steroidobacteraceae bacterium]
MTTDAAVLDREARRRAIDPAASYIVQAPAGSGKTSLLTLRYLRLLADVDRPEQILAITFTRKAAAEMRHRIVAALELAAREAPANAESHLRELHGLARAALARSRERGWGLEHNPARLHVQTIDGLNHWLARRLPLAARIGTAATLVDDASAMYAEAARRTVALLDEDSAVSASLLRLARALNHEPRMLAQLIEGMLGARELWLPKLMNSPGRPALRAGIDRLLHGALEAELADIRRRLGNLDCRTLFAICQAAAAAGAPEGPILPLARLQDLPPATADAVPYWQALAELLLKASPATDLRKTVGARQGFLPASDSPGWKSIKQRMTSFLEGCAEREGLAQAFAAVRMLPPAGLTDGQWERIDALCDVLPHAVAELLALFAERDTLDHPAVAAAARDALGAESAPTELALALDYRIRHLLVDEYQDTSPSQEALLRLLVAGWQPGDGRTLFCVGDPMQSIYAFREADVTLFLEAQRQGIGAVPLIPERLGRNFRSGAAIVDWVNATFSALLPASDDFERGAVRYSPAVAARPGEAGDGVRVHPLIDADDGAMAAEVAAIVQQALAGASPLPSIAILVRGRPSLPPILAALRDARIEYRGVELESLLDRPAMRDLAALAQAMLHEGNRTAWLAVLRAPWCGLTLADLLQLATPDSGFSIRQRLSDAALLRTVPVESAARITRLRAVLEPAIADRGERSLGGWLKAAWLALDGPATIGDASDIANAELLFSALDRLELEAGCTPEASAIDAAVAGVMASPVGSDAARVQVMTIHRAKGLEFDVVILPDLQRGARATERPLLYWTPVATGPGERGMVLASRTDAAENEGAADALERWMRRLGTEREALELGRIAYVAATRARRHLHLVASASSRQTDDGVVLRRPRATSLLGFLWPALSSEFEQALAARAAAGAAPMPAAAGRRRLTAPPLRRLVAGFISPAPPSPPQPARLRISGEPEGSIRPEFDWAGAIAQAVGQVVHFELQRIAESGFTPEAGDMPAARWRRQLRELGIDDAHLPAALARIAEAMTAVGRSQRAAELLDPAALEARSELALTAVVDGVLQSLRIDRTFVDRDGVRWVIDWKTSAHEGGDREAFLDNELERYRN